MLFNDAQSYDTLNAGTTIYTTLEPCPFCTSALLVSRVKRIVFINPDSTYGNSFYSLWMSYYKTYDCHKRANLIIQVLQGTGMTDIKIFLFFAKGQPDPDLILPVNGLFVGS
ncbi:hypothetical protein [Mucilaginibacter gossypii]|uniref:hypothetical protein n=1 Tax=Mucilaginibacter gossypii TaxID=551996 RepID=UPI000DCEEDF2|nr:hypothetical protein DIU36_21215 [Mucilaginibacter rubeus]